MRPQAQIPQDRHGCAKLLAEMGCKLFAVKSGEKEPQYDGWQAAATADPKVVAQMVPRGSTQNFGVFTGSLADGGAILGLDIDVKNGKPGFKSLADLEAMNGDLPETFTVSTPTGGEHRYFHVDAPVAPSVDKIGVGLDIRSAGSYVVGPCSTLKNGGTYRITKLLPFAQAPAWLIDACGRPSARAENASVPLAGIDPDRATARAVEYLKTAPVAVEGQGGDLTTFKVAARVKDFGCDAAETLELMLDHWNDRCAPPWSSDDLQEKVRSAFKSGTQPQGAAAPEAVFTVVVPDPDVPVQQPKRDLILKPGTKSPAGITANVEAVLADAGVTVSYDVLAKDVKINIPGFACTVDNAERVTLQHIADLCTMRGVPAVTLDEMVLTIADRNPRNPVADWVLSKPWDGVDRVAALIDSIEGPSLADVRYADGSVSNLKTVLVERWLASAIGALFEPDGIAAQGVLVFAGAQNLRKTTWFKKLVPLSLSAYFGEGVSLDPSNKDSVSSVVSRWLIELGELDSTFSKTELGALKAFITKSRDSFRRPYARKENSYPRRTVFSGTVNQPDFLRDSTGNRRYWTVPVTRLRVDHGIDMQQLWSQVRESLYRQGDYTSWCLSDHEVTALNANNDEYTEDDPVSDALATGYDWTKTPTERTTAMDVIRALGLGAVRDAPRHIRRLAEKHGAKSLRTGQGRWLIMPPRMQHTGTTFHTVRPT